MKIKPFKFTAASADLSAAVRRVSGVVAQGATPTYCVASTDQKLYVVGLAGEYRAAVQVANAESSSEGIFCAQLEHLEGVCKGRNVMEMSFDGKQCNFQGVKTRYSGHFTTSAVAPDILTMTDDLLDGKSGGKTSLSTELIEAIKATLALTNIKDVYHGTNLVNYIQVSGGKLRVSCFDANHFALATCKVKAPDMKVSMPGIQFALIGTLSDGHDVRMNVSTSGLTVSGKTFKAILPSTQAEDKHFSMVADFIKSISTSDYQCTYDYASLAATTENLMALYKVNTSFAMSAKKDSSSLAIGLTSEVGKASESLKVEPIKARDFRAAVDPRLFKDILDLAKNIEGCVFGVTKRVLTLSGTSGEIDLFLACSRME